MATGWQRGFTASVKHNRQVGMEVDLRNAVWNGKINQMSTAEVAAKFEMTQAKALRLLKQIASGQSRDERFRYEAERQGVFVSDGSLFTYSPMDIDGQGMSDKRPKHYIWFCS